MVPETAEAVRAQKVPSLSSPGGRFDAGLPNQSIWALKIRHNHLNAHAPTPTPIKVAGSPFSARYRNLPSLSYDGHATKPHPRPSMATNGRRIITIGRQLGLVIDRATADALTQPPAPFRITRGASTGDLL
jgi:hypothetical protein